MRASGSHGQASIELVAAVPALVLAGLIALQLLATGHAHTLAEGAAEAGALAGAAGLKAEPAALGALPEWARARARVQVEGGWVRVALQPPSPLGPASRALEVSADAWARVPRGESG